MKSLHIASLAVGVLTVIPAAAQTRGSYLGSCENIRQRGAILEAQCEDRYGGLRFSRIDLRDCGRGDIANRNGRLVCSGARGERARGFEDQGPRYGGQRGPGRIYGDPRY